MNGPATPRAHADGDVLIVFARAPVSGRAKTRLIPVLGADGAAALHRDMVDRTLAASREARRRCGCQLEIRLDGCQPDAARAWLGDDLAIVPQAGDSLGERMRRPFDDHFAAGAPRVVLVGTDVPALTADILVRAFGALGRDDVVFGPAADGGYYLIGLRRPMPTLFDEMPWGGPEVLAASLARARSAGASVVCLETLTDVDRPDDLAAWTATAPQAGLPATRA